MNIGLILLSICLTGLVIVALRRREPAGPVLKRMVEQFAKLVPRMLCALLGAGFLAQLIPQQAIAALLGEDAGLIALPIAALTGVIVPAGPVISFAIAALFAKSGATTAALVTIITSWAIFGLHRVFVYEVPLLGASFTRLRLVSGAVLPLVAGGIATLVGLVISYGTAVPH